MRQPARCLTTLMGWKMGNKDKALLRRAVRARIAQIAEDEAHERSKVMCDELEHRIALSGAKVVALFSPLADEPQLWPLVERLTQTQSVVLPRVEGDVMNFYIYDKDAMAKGAYGINEPRSGVPVNPGEIDAVVVPGVAFTVHGARMGRGKGFYDRYLSQNDFSALKIGVCYSEQIVPDIPTELHDVKMAVVIYK